MKEKIIGIIPARLASTRLERKLLQDICGKSVLQRTYESVLQSRIFDEVLIAADHEELISHATSFGADAIMTSTSHQSGTDRIAELASKYQARDIIINIQGDEPFISKEHLTTIVGLFNTTIEIASLYTKIESTEELHQNSVVKLCFDLNYFALFFSRHPIPYLRNSATQNWLEHYNYYRHIGIYGFRNETLQKITKLKISSLEKAESLEQLRWLENGYKIKMGEVKEKCIGIDTEMDLVNARKLIVNSRKL